MVLLVCTETVETIRETLIILYVLYFMKLLKKKLQYNNNFITE